MLAIANIPLTTVVGFGFGCFAGFVSTPGISKEGVTTVLRGFAFVDVGTRLYTVVLGIFCSSVLVYMVGCYGIHRLVSRGLERQEKVTKSNSQFIRIFS